MLKAYKQLFDELNHNNINYIIYKGLNHIDKDLEGERGDIDLLIDDLQDFEKIIKNERWCKVLEKNYPYYYFKLDKEKNLMLDVENRIRLGDKPYRPYYFNIDLNKFKTVDYKGIQVLSYEDYIPLLFLMRIASSSNEKVNLVELQELIKTKKTNGYMQQIAEKLTESSWEEIERDVLEVDNLQDLKEKYKKSILQNSQVDNKFLFLQRFKFLIGKLKSIKIKIFKIPPYTVRKKGYLVAFMGNDGAGKSSSIDFIKEMDYFKYTGIKRIYFGNNEYVIPFLNYLMRKSYKNRLLVLFFGLLGYFDKQIRSLIAQYYIKIGCIVLADRYFYDEIISREYPKNTIKKGKLKLLFGWLIKPRMLIKPKITIFLDVDPEVAYSRKQDYEYELVVENIQKYRIFLSKIDEVIKIDANQEQSKVLNDVIMSIYEQDVKFN